MDYVVFVIGVNSVDEFVSRDLEVTLTEFILNDRMMDIETNVRFMELKETDILHKDFENNFSIDTYEKAPQRCDVAIVLATEDRLKELTVLCKLLRERGCKDVRCGTVSKSCVPTPSKSFSFKRKKNESNQ